MPSVEHSGRVSKPEGSHCANAPIVRSEPRREIFRIARELRAQRVEIRRGLRARAELGGEALRLLADTAR